MHLFQVVEEGLRRGVLVGSGGWMDFQCGVRMVSIVGIEWGYPGGGALGVVIDEFG